MSQQSVAIYSQGSADSRGNPLDPLRQSLKRSRSGSFDSPPDERRNDPSLPRQVTESRGKRNLTHPQHDYDDNMTLADLLGSGDQHDDDEDNTLLVDLTRSPKRQPSSEESTRKLSPLVVDLSFTPPDSSVGFMPTIGAIPELPVDSTPAPASAEHPESSSVLEEKVPAEPPPTKKRRYSLKSSAYLQNLAEICFTIMQDSRWRIPSNQQQHTLFRWEEGDDLRMVVSFSRQYIPPPPKIQVRCCCLLCEQQDPRTPTILEQPQQQLLPHPTVIEDGSETRSLYLLARLFYRKGPWFRLDDMYQRYYAPEREQKADKDAAASIDHELLRHQVHTVLPEMLDDVQGLFRTGMVRGFKDESECGRTIEAAVLTVEERKVILAKLGGNTKKGGKSSIWKQMTSQTGLFTRSSLLPVLRHVNDMLVDRLAQQVVISCCSSKNISKKDLRLHSGTVKSRILELQKGVFQGQRLFHQCLRFAEKPLAVLQRCARLYVCATSGPGDMRGNGTNGWRSVSTIHEMMPQDTTILPPGQHLWHEIRYQGLEYRFGLRSAPFFHTYKHLPLENKDDDGLRIFPTRVDFQRWELCVELRSFVDYALEFDEAVRYDQRRVARGKDPIRGCREDSFVEVLEVTTEQGRRQILCSLLHLTESQVLDLNEQLHQQNHVFATQNPCPLALMTIGTLAYRVLSISSEQRRETTQPWLRHLSWRCCLAPLFEREGCYVLAIQALQVLLFGSYDPEETLNKGSFRTNYSLGWSCYLSRRARGKAIDRLIIDMSHCFRAQCSDLDKKKKKQETELFQQRLNSFSYDMVRAATSMSAFGFSSLRTIARRLKKPLRDILNGLTQVEAHELGLRLGESSDQTRGKDFDWQPITDVSVANAIGGQGDPGSRCAFIGHEDSYTRSSSLNVEEYALEMYGSGRLPIADEVISGGGWVGWHNEGSYLRALFRILCSGPLLGAGHCYQSDQFENFDVHLSPYQEAPFDLHVGFELQKLPQEPDPTPIAGIYYRRSSTIHLFLDFLAQCDPSKLANLVFDSVKARLEFAHANSLKDASLIKDVQQVRTLSALAAGLGGKALSRSFRCLLYDYRHYSGGLPDLQLIRAVKKRAAADTLIIDLEWIGESFSATKREEEEAGRAFAILFDKDDEYLGCEKVGDAQSSRRGKSFPSGSSKAKTALPKLSDMPERLQLIHDGDPIEVQSLLVEVKSKNDRLDPRQEDWLNVLSLNGFARVCKFEATKKKGKQMKD